MFSGSLSGFAAIQLWTEGGAGLGKLTYINQEMKVEVALGFSPNHASYLSVSFWKKEDTCHFQNKYNLRLKVSFLLLFPLSHYYSSNLILWLLQLLSLRTITSEKTKQNKIIKSITYCIIQLHKIATMAFGFLFCSFLFKLKASKEYESE